MSNFDFVFSLFGLLLGFSLVEVLGGLGKALRARERVSIGWLVPLLGMFVMFDITSFWMTVWNIQGALPVSSLTLFSGLIFTSLYYLVASLVVPDDLVRWPEFDAYYFGHKRLVLIGVFLLNVPGWVAEALLASSALTARYVISNLVWVVLLTALIFVHGRRANIALLAAVISTYLISGIVWAFVA